MVRFPPSRSSCPPAVPAEPSQFVAGSLLFSGSLLQRKWAQWRGRRLDQCEVCQSSGSSRQDRRNRGGGVDVVGQLADSKINMRDVTHERGSKLEIPLIQLECSPTVSTHFMQVPLEPRGGEPRFNPCAIHIVLWRRFGGHAACLMACGGMSKPRRDVALSPEPALHRGVSSRIARCSEALRQVSPAGIKRASTNLRLTPAEPHKCATGGKEPERDASTGSAIGNSEVACSRKTLWVGADGLEPPTPSL